MNILLESLKPQLDKIYVKFGIVGYKKHQAVRCVMFDEENSHSALFFPDELNITMYDFFKKLLEGKDEPDRKNTTDNP